MTTKEMIGEEIKNILFTFIISADNDEFEEDLKQELLSRHEERPDDWGYIYEPLGDTAKKLLELYKEVDKKDEDRKS